MEKAVIEHKALENGFVYIWVKNSFAEAKIALQGAHIFHYKRVNEEPLLWLSEVTDFEYGKAIRGGIPICSPWFGFNENKNLPQHGFARTSLWEFVSGNESNEKSSSLIFRLRYSDETLKLWRYKFELELHIIISDKLTIELKTTNIDCESFKLTQALHTYFQLSHISNVSVKGLDQKPYFDALNGKKSIQNGDIYFDQEVDRVYQEVTQIVTLKDIHREIEIKNSGSSSVVVWNPWIEKTKRMSAMREDAYEYMLCIESTNTFEDARVLRPKESHILKAIIS
jgi:glucose-6-phosphate 1-epimerase